MIIQNDDLRKLVASLKTPMPPDPTKYVATVAIWENIRRGNFHSFHGFLPTVFRCIF